MPLPVVTKETADSVAQIAQKNSMHHIALLQNLQKSNPVLFQYLDYTLSLVTAKFSADITAEVGSIVGTTLALLESQAESDDMAQQFQAEENS